MTMRLATRLTIYYASSITVILVGFSVALYAMVAEHLYRQVDERIESALDTLAAAAEIDEEGVSWEHEDRLLSFGRRTLDGRFFWQVADERGIWIDGSAKDDDVDRAFEPLKAAGSTGQPVSFADESGTEWRAVSRHLRRPTSAGGDLPSAETIDGSHKGLVLSAGTSLEALRSNLRNLAATLASLSLVVWTLALVTGRRLCRVALRPLTEMAEAAQAIGGDEAERRLPAPQADNELGELGRSFNALLDRLEESHQRQQRFTGDASHQLATPLTAIQGHVDLALRADRPSDEYRRVLSLVQTKTRHLRQMIDGLMFLSRADAEARRPSLERVELHAWLLDHLANWHNPRRSDLIYELDGDEACRACVHPPLLGELVNNLLDNAAKYSPSDTPICVRLSHKNGRVLLAVSDNGWGIDPADLPHIFDPFFRAESVRMQGSQGLGLGLSVAARIAALFGGEIAVSSTPGHGACFTINLPTSET